MPDAELLQACQTDPLTEALESLAFRGWVAGPLLLGGPWGVSVAPGVAGLHIVTRGRCWLTVDGLERPVLLAQGDMVVLPQRPAHRLQDELTSPSVSLDELIRSDHSTKGPGPIHNGDSGHASLVSGNFISERREMSLLCSALPSLIHLPGRQGRMMPWLEDTLRLMLPESVSDRPGAQAIVNRLVQILLIQAVRAYVSEMPARGASWLKALLDPDVGPALGLIHRYPEKPWTVASLADRVAMSRSVFSARFTSIVGMPPLQYLRERRMQKASRMLRDRTTGLRQIASRTGYQSVTAFSSAFKRWSGVTPGAYRRETNGL